MYTNPRDILTIFVSLIIYVLMLPSRFFRKIIILDKEVLKLKGQVVFVSNHKSILDPWIISSSLPFSFFIKNLPVKTLVSMNKFGSFKILTLLRNSGIIPFIHWLYQSVPIPELGTSEEKLIDFQKEINKGCSVLFFPEGGIKTNVEIGEIKQGISILRRNNPNIPFVFMTVRYKKTRLPFYRRSCFVLGSADFDQYENYQEFVKGQFLKLISKI
jgi:1-acyl-sn-glycerol-3-phosphate acyltransferase